MSESLFQDIKYNVVVDTAEQPAITKEKLFERLVGLEQQMETIKSDIKACKEGFTFDEDMNPKGLEKDVVKSVAAFAKKYVADGLDKVIETAEIYKQLKEELIGD